MTTIKVKLDEGHALDFLRELRRIITDFNAMSGRSRLGASFAQDAALKIMDGEEVEVSSRIAEDLEMFFSGLSKHASSKTSIDVARKWKISKPRSEEIANQIDGILIKVSINETEPDPIGDHYTPEWNSKSQTWEDPK